ncbi:hypothetical protein L9F63_003853, partial [Diploptera punctata]
SLNKLFCSYFAQKYDYYVEFYILLPTASILKLDEGKLNVCSCLSNTSSMYHIIMNICR